MLAKQIFTFQFNITLKFLNFLNRAKKKQFMKNKELCFNIFNLINSSFEDGMENQKHFHFIDSKSPLNTEYSE